LCTAAALLLQRLLIVPQIELLWSRLSLLERRLARGEYDPQQTRVLKPSLAAPCSSCIDLRIKLQQAEAAAASAVVSANDALSSSSSVTSTVDVTAVQQQLRDREADLARAVKDSQRFQKVLCSFLPLVVHLTVSLQVGEQMLREYKEICKSLFGFSVSRLAESHKTSSDEHTVQYTVRVPRQNKLQLLR
jgi:hypothetical protein